MADFQSPHPTTGGKSLDNLPANPYTAQQSTERGPYKSWRKKYRKMRSRFDGVLEENKKLFKEEQKLEGIAKRLREELDGLLDICLDLNENPSLPPELRFNIRLPPRHAPPIEVPANISPEQANGMVMDYKVAVQQASIPALDLQVVRSEIEQKLAAQNTQPLDTLAASIPSHPVASMDNMPEDLRGDEPPAYMTPEQENEYLLRLDAKLGDPYAATTKGPSAAAIETGSKADVEEKHFAEMTPREYERYIEFANPLSQHNWLKAHHKLGPGGADVDDNESLASHEAKPARKRGNKNLAKQVGDRALERAREGWSPGAASANFADDDELSVMDDHPSGSGSSRKKARDPDSTYRIKGGTSGGAGSSKPKAKRKRTSGDDIPGGGKKAKTESSTAGLE